MNPRLGQVARAGQTVGGAVPGAVRAGVDVAAVQADDQRQVRARQLGPLGGAAGDEARPFVARVRSPGVARWPAPAAAPWWRAGPGPAAGLRSACRRTDRRTPARRNGPAGRTTPGWSAPAGRRPAG